METWPALPYEDWRDTLATLHMYSQVIGKLRVAQSPFEPEWANVGLYLTPRGLTTSAIPYGLACFDAEFDFVDHELVLRASNEAAERIALSGQDVADFYQQVMEALKHLGMPVAYLHSAYATSKTLGKWNPSTVMYDFFLDELAATK